MMPATERWFRCRRPVAIVGGELTLDMLDLTFNPVGKFYEAPAQLKATNGVFVLDDFGRQRTSARSILNRWIVPLERGVDYLTLHTGKKFPVLFDELVVFSTNMHPADIGDDAMLRRLYYKIEVPEPTREDYDRIWKDEFASRGLDFSDELMSYLEQNLLQPKGIPRRLPRALHGRSGCRTLRLPQTADADRHRTPVAGLRQPLPLEDRTRNSVRLKSSSDWKLSGSKPVGQAVNSSAAVSIRRCR
ncbi:MAG: hypothetical protein R3C97_06445 [Geminicoccaceae bacterium]